jgi:ribosomal protein S18 acetylase RimI-like enzyme
MHFKNLKNISTQVLTDTFNKSFEGYEIPLHFEVSAFERKLHVEHFSPKYSVGAINDKDELVGFIIHCDSVNNAHILYNCGTGVLPAYRGKGLTKAMYQYFFNQLKQTHHQELVLEVLVDNQPAYKSYLASGFVLNRHFISYKGRSKKSIINHDIKIEELNQDLEKKLKPFMSIKPSWQNDFQAMRLSESFLEVFGAYDGQKLIGYLFYNPLSKRIHQLAVHPDYRRLGVGSSLLGYLSKKYPDEFTIINIDHRHPEIHSFLNQHDFKSLVKLDELILHF